MCELSLEYNALTDEEKAHYAQMGRLAQNVFLMEGHRTHGIKHNVKKSASATHEDVAPVPDGSSDDGVVDPDASDVPRVQRAAVEGFLRDSRTVLEQARLTKAQKKLKREQPF